MVIGYKAFTTANALMSNRWKKSYGKWRGPLKGEKVGLEKSWSIPFDGKGFLECLLEKP
jgi:hypothetical protein